MKSSYLILSPQIVRFPNSKHRYRRYVTVKIFIKSTSLGHQLDDELNIYKRIERAHHNHPGRKYVRSLLDSFDVTGPEDQHRCLVHPPLWESVLAFLHRNPLQRLPTPVLAVTLHRLFLALDYLHTECKIIHTGIFILYPRNLNGISAYRLTRYQSR